MTSLEKIVAVVTGAAQGIGATFARALTQEGARVVVTDILDPSETVKHIRDAGGEAIGSQGDITDNDYLASMVRETERGFGPVGVLVNNAGIFATLKLKPFTEIPDEEWDRVMTVNVRGMFQCTKAIVPSMVRGGSGRIVNIASGTFFYGAPGMMHYVASKGAVIAMTRSMARELADKNIMVNAIAPGFTHSEGVLKNPDMSVIRNPTVSSRMIKRDMVPEDLTGVLLFLVSDRNRFMTGQTMNVDGGRHTY